MGGQWFTIEDTYMAYNPNIPAATDLTSVSQGDIKENFTQIQNLIDVNHETFDAPNGQGKHKYITIPQQALGAAGANEIVLGAQTFAPTGLVELFLQNSANEWPITPSNQNASGYTMTPSNLLIKWANMTINNNSGGPFNLVWPAAGNYIAYGTQLWATAVVGAVANAAVDVNAVAYITNISNAAQVTFVTYQRAATNSPGSNAFPYDVWVVAIGIPA